MAIQFEAIGSAAAERRRKEAAELAAKLEARGMLTNRFRGEAGAEVVSVPDKAAVKRVRAVAKVTRVAQQIEAGEPEDAPRTKTQISIRVDDEVIAFFKALGPNWTSRINDVLLRVVREGADRWLEGK